jgi:hypothetical protein
MADQFSRLYDVERVGGDQRTRLAELLRSQGMNQPQGQMVGGWYVAPSWSQNLNSALQTGLGTYMGAKIDEERNQQLADLMRRRKEGVAVEQPQQIQNFNGMERMGGGQTPFPQTEQVPQNELERLTRKPQMPVEQSQMNPALIQQQAQPKYRPMTEAELEENTLKMYNADPRMASVISSMDATRAAREEARAMKEEQRAWQSRENELTRQARHEDKQMMLAMRTPASEKPLTEFQGKSTSYGSRAATSHNILNAYEGDTNNMGVNAAQWVSNVPLVGTAANAMLDANQQRVAQAQRDFINSTLRQESGAVIGPTEFENARKQYFPQPGDTDEVIAQKRANRALVVKGFARQAGPGGRDIAEAFNAPVQRLASENKEPAKSIVPSVNSTRTGVTTSNW